MLYARSAALVVAAIALASCASSSRDASSADAGPRNTAELKALVREAGRLVEKDGEAAFTAFDQEGGRFRRGNDYVFVLDARGNCLYHGFEPGRVGENVASLADDEGRAYGKRLVEIAGGKPSSGWAFYKKTEPATGRAEWKATRLVHATTPAGATLTVGCGAYGLRPDRELLVDMVEDAAQALALHDRAALDAIDDEKGPFVYRDVAVFVEEMDGVLLANALFPELIGKNVFETRGPDGKSPADEHIRVAKTRGFGFCEYAWYHPDGVPGRKLAYVRRVTFEGRPVVVGASLYLDRHQPAETPTNDTSPEPPAGEPR